MELVRSGSDKDYGPDEEWTRILDRGGRDAMIHYLDLSIYCLLVITIQ